MVAQAVAAAYQSVRLKHAIDLILSPTGLRYDQLTTGDEYHRELLRGIADVDIGCEFVVVGFDFAGDGEIYTVQHPGIVSNQNVAGWTAIGCGEDLAINTLLHYSVNQRMDHIRRAVPCVPREICG